MIGFTMNEQMGYVVASITGQPTYEEFAASLEALKAFDEFHPWTHRICDITRGDIYLNAAELGAFIEDAMKLPTERSAKTAFIATEPRQRAAIDTFSAAMNRGEYRLFSNGTDALSWILESRSEQPPEGRSIRVHRLMGDVDPRVVLAMQNAWYSDEGFDDDAPVLWDLRKARLDVSLEQIRELAERMTTMSIARRPDGRAAVLLGPSLPAHMLEEGFQEGVQRGRLRFFRSESKATEFLLERSNKDA